MSALPRPRQYHSYKGKIGVLAPNLLCRNFDTDGPYRKMGTDVTQFSIQYGKLYLSPIIDFQTREVLAYDLSTVANFNQIRRMLSQLKKKYGKWLNRATLHSDQGWQYQMKYYQ